MNLINSCNGVLRWRRRPCWLTPSYQSTLSSLFSIGTLSESRARPPPPAAVPAPRGSLPGGAPSEALRKVPPLGAVMTVSPCWVVVTFVILILNYFLINFKTMFWLLSNVKWVEKCAQEWSAASAPLEVIEEVLLNDVCLRESRRSPVQVDGDQAFLRGNLKDTSCPCHLLVRLFYWLCVMQKGWQNKLVFN